MSVVAKIGIALVECFCSYCKWCLHCCVQWRPTGWWPKRSVNMSGQTQFPTGCCYIRQQQSSSLLQHQGIASGYFYCSHIRTFLYLVIDGTNFFAKNRIVIVPR